MNDLGFMLLMLSYFMFYGFLYLIYHKTSLFMRTELRTTMLNGLFVSSPWAYYGLLAIPFHHLGIWLS